MTLETADFCETCAGYGGVWIVRSPTSRVEELAPCSACKGKGFRPRKRERTTPMPRDTREVRGDELTTRGAE